MENDDLTLNDGELGFNIEPFAKLHIPKKTGEVYFQFESLIDRSKNPPIKIFDVQDYEEFSIHIETKAPINNIDLNRSITFRDEIGGIAMTLFVKQCEE
jgi:hypothetical protein